MSASTHLPASRSACPGNGSQSSKRIPLLVNIRTITCKPWSRLTKEPRVLQERLQTMTWLQALRRAVIIIQGKGSEITYALLSPRFLLVSRRRFRETHSCLTRFLRLATPHCTPSRPLRARPSPPVRARLLRVGGSQKMTKTTVLGM